MNPIAKRLAPKIASAIVRGPLKRIMDRRFAKGGRLVTWWRSTFGELTMDGGAVGDAGRFAAATRAFKRGDMSPREYAKLYTEELERQRREKP